MKRVQLVPNNAALAKRLAAQGLFVFPANPASKRPMIRWKKGPITATTDLGQIDRWWRGGWTTALPAIDLGKSGLFVLDADRHNPDKDGVAALAALFEVHGRPAGVPLVRTAGNGEHYYFRQPIDPLGCRR
jgi:hypothetical protein